MLVVLLQGTGSDRTGVSRSGVGDGERRLLTDPGLSGLGVLSRDPVGVSSLTEEGGVPFKSVCSIGKPLPPPSTVFPVEEKGSVREKEGPRISYDEGVIVVRERMTLPGGRTWAF